MRADSGDGGRGAPHPLVSVGIPTHNGERFVRATLESLAGQDYSNIEFLISDNASTDRTLDICRDVAAADSRFRIHAEPENRGAAANFARVLADARGAYFMWAGDHDLWSPTYVSRCVAALESDRGVVLAYSQTTLIDGLDNPISRMNDALDITQPKAVDRYLNLIWTLAVCNAVYGVVRTEIAQGTGGPEPVVGADHLVLAQLALEGRFVQIPEPLFLRRENRPSETADAAEARRLREMTGEEVPAVTREVSLRRLRGSHIRALRRSALNPIDRLRAEIGTVFCFAERFSVTDPPFGALRRLLRNRIARRLAPGGISGVTRPLG